MQTQSNHVALAIVISALMVSGTLLALNLRTTVPVETISTNEHYVQLLYSGCTRSADMLTLSCPLWVRP